MLEHDLKMERAICVMLRKTIARSQKASDFGTATLLKQVLMAAEDRAHHLDHYLAEDGLRQ
jgi:bacterioferritin (cytochrome b1)